MRRIKAWDWAVMGVMTVMQVVIWLEPWSDRVRLHVMAVMIGYFLFDLGRRLGARRP